MVIGDVYKFVTNQATGYDSKPKIHIALGRTEAFRAPAEYAFLFISSGDYGGCFPVYLADYGGFLEYDSFISCGKLVYYSYEELKAMNLKQVGRISDEHLQQLRNHLADHDVMVSWEILIACEALKAFV